MKRKKTEQGFMLMELLVVTGLIIFITGLTLFNTQTTKSHLALDRAVHQFAQDVSRVHELSLRSEAYTCGSGSISGYGLAVNQAIPGSYLIFAECNGNNSYQSGSDGIVETITLSKGVVISQISPSPSWSIVFVPPEPQVFLKPGTPSQVQITLALEQDTMFSKVIFVNARGIVDVQ